MPTTKAVLIPKTLGACADRLFTIRNKRLEIQKLVDSLQAEESALKDHLINKLPKSDASGVAGKLARVSVTVKDIPQVQDWEKFHAYVKKTGDFDLLQRRLTNPAIQERWDAGKEVPGVDHFKAVTVSINKV